MLDLREIDVIDTYQIGEGDTVKTDAVGPFTVSSIEDGGDYFTLAGKDEYDNDVEYESDAFEKWVLVAYISDSADEDI